MFEKLQIVDTTVTANENPLCVEELLKSVFDAVVRSCDGLVSRMPAGVLAEVGDDSDWHKTNKGYMRYTWAALIENGRWLLAFSENGGGYPADQYACELTLMPVNSTNLAGEELVSKVAEALRTSSYFRNSVFVGLDNGYLGSPDNVVALAVGRSLSGLDESFIAQKLLNRDDVVNTDMSPVVARKQTYKPATVELIATAIQDALAHRLIAVG
jgi:hypothetical protein